MGRVLIRVAYICSSCETALKLKVGDKMPERCPYCSEEFTHDDEYNRVVNDHEETITTLKSPD